MKHHTKILFLSLLLALMAPALAIETVSVTLVTDHSGNASEQTRLVAGEVVGLRYLNGNFTAEGNLTIQDDCGLLIDGYNLSSGDIYRLPGLQYENSTDAWGPYALFSNLWLNMTLQQDNKTATVLILYRQV